MFSTTRSRQYQPNCVNISLLSKLGLLAIDTCHQIDSIPAKHQFWTLVSIVLFAHISRTFAEMQRRNQGEIVEEHMVLLSITTHIPSTFHAHFGNGKYFYNRENGVQNVREVCALGALSPVGKWLLASGRNACCHLGIGEGRPAHILVHLRGGLLGGQKNATNYLPLTWRRERERERYIERERYWEREGERERERKRERERESKKSYPIEDESMKTRTAHRTKMPQRF